MVSKLTKKPENSSTGIAVTGPTKVATCQGNTTLHQTKVYIFWLIMWQIIFIISSMTEHYRTRQK